jgi:hypothetical protein
MDSILYYFFHTAQPRKHGYKYKSRYDKFLPDFQFRWRFRSFWVWHSVEWYIITGDPQINNGSISSVVQVRVVFRYDPEMEVDIYSDMSVPVHQYTRHHVS